MKCKITLFALLVSVSCFSQLNVDLLMRYTFNGNTNDITGQGYDGIPFGVTYVDDMFGNANSACYFNGLDNYIEFPNVAELKTPLPVSFSFWVKYESMNYQNQVILNTSFENNRSSGVWFNSTSANNHYAVNFGDGGYNYIPDTRRTFVSNSVITSGWHHVAAVVHSADYMQIFIDKVEIGGDYSGNGGDLLYSITPGCIGRHDRNMSGPADYFFGTLDEFQYWSRALSQTEVNELYDLQLSVSEMDTVKPYVTLYPNPVHDNLNVETNLEGDKTIIIYNNQGQQVYNGDFLSKLPIGTYSSGLYYVVIKNYATEVIKKIVIR